jgi:hypothetical protein
MGDTGMKPAAYKKTINHSTQIVTATEKQTDKLLTNKEF